ncbi:F-box protein At-B [Telopea speciosissima]|uniref:F-box protein At-B n=1 Tax=Telopea speciosissima TaxID=54955 RepID=UPI001CC55D35|nr:F-box protein At-B [Telopea speciosissima]
MNRRTSNQSFERLPSAVLEEILVKMDVESLCSAACASRTLRSSVSQILSSLSSLDLSGFSPNSEILNCVLRENEVLKSLTLNCLRLDDSSVRNFIGSSLQELVLQRCSLLSYQIFCSIGERCPSLRVLVLEMGGQGLPQIFKKNLAQMLKGCANLETLSLKIRGTAELDADGFESIELFLPRTIKILRLQPVLEHDVMQFMHETRVDRNSVASDSLSIPTYPAPIDMKLHSISLVLDIISDELLISIANNLQFLIELDLEDRPSKEPLLHHDMTNSGLQSLSSCRHLTCLSLTRSKQNFAATFKRVNDMGMFLLAEGCKSLESVRLGGFSRVSDAGFAAILHSCKSLKKFEVFSAFFLSDLAFHNFSEAPSSLTEVRLVSCSLITSETVGKLSSCRSLEVLDLWGCKSVADNWLGLISTLSGLTTLNLGGADITDNSLSVLSMGNSPIASLCLRGCKRVTDKGIALLFRGGGTISKTLSALDLGYMPGISDKAVRTVAEAGLKITDLCIRYCYFVTDASMEVLASKRRSKGHKPIQNLDIYHCIGLSLNLLAFLRRPSFCGLRWLGIGQTSLSNRRNANFAEIYRDRPWLTVCWDGCEMGCHNGWHFHGPEDHLF